MNQSCTRATGPSVPTIVGGLIFLCLAGSAGCYRVLSTSGHSVGFSVMLTLVGAAVLLLLGIFATLGVSFAARRIRSHAEPMSAATRDEPMR